MRKTKGKYKSISAPAEALRWAVCLGCTNARRLSIEWGIPLMSAHFRLSGALRRGQIKRVGRGQYGLAP